MKTLLIGAHTGGIGDEFAKVWEEAKMPTSDEWVVHELYKPKVTELDVSSMNSIASYLNEHGPFDEVVYSAGINKLSRVEDLNLWDLNKMFEVNVYGLPIILGAHLKRWPEHEGRAVQVVSDAAHTPMRQSLAYCASKAAAEMSVRVMARELFPQWTVIGVNPGVVEGTPMSESVDAKVRDMRGWTQAEAEEYEARTSVLGRRVQKHEIANLLWYALRGPEALNGSIITINGGK